MELIILGSSSTGNGYLLRSSSGEILVIEAGIPLRKLKEATGFIISGIRGVLISHSHKDHSGRAGEYLAAGIKCFTSHEAAQQILSTYHHKLSGNMSYTPDPENKEMIFHHYNMMPVAEKVVHVAGNFSFMPFPLTHDVKCYGYLIRHEECGQIVFITDTLFCDYKFKGLNHMIIEANYSDKILDDNTLRGSSVLKVRDRVKGSHMSLDTCKKFIMTHDLRTVRTITLIHLSSSNSNASQFQKEVMQLTGKSVNIATTGLIINLNKQAF